MRRLVALVVVVLLILSPGRAVAVYLPAPAGLEAIGGAGQIVLRWSYGTPGQWPLDHFRIYRSVDNGATWCLYDTITWSGPFQPEYVDYQPSSGPYVTAYYVTAVADGEESQKSNTAAALPTSGGVYNPPCTGGAGSPGGGDNGGGGSDPGGGSGPGGGDPGGGGPGDDEPDDPGGGPTCDPCSRLDLIRQVLQDIQAGLVSVEDALWLVWSAVIGVEDAVVDLSWYLQNPNAPVPSPPAIPIGPGYAPPPAPDLTPVMPQLGQRTGRPSPTVPTLYVPPDVPAPPALPPIQDPALSPWGLPVRDPLESSPPLSPNTAGVANPPLRAQPPVDATPPAAPQAPLQANPPMPPTTALAPQQPRSPVPARQPRPAMNPASPLAPGAPLVPQPPLKPRR